MKFSFCLLTVLLLFKNLSLCSNSQLKIRGIYGFTPNSFREKNPDEISKKLKEWNINAVFSSDIEESYLETFYREDIQVFIDIVCFHGEQHWKSHPESRPINSFGKPVEKVKWYAGVCPSQEWLRKDIIKRAEKFSKRRGVRGIWLDFIRYPVHWEVPDPKIEQSCFCSLCVSKFQKESGISIPEEHQTILKKAEWILKYHKKEWVEWKCANIASLVEDVSKAVKAINPKCLIGIFGVPWRAEEGGHEIVGQDYALLSQYADIFSPMVYYPLTMQSKKWMIGIIQYVREKTSRPVWPILYAGDQNHPLSFKEIQSALNEIARSGSEGILVISMEELFRKGVISHLFLSN